MTISKAKLYGIIENSLPPFLFKTLKKAPFYRWAVNHTQFMTGSIEPEIVTIKEGDLTGHKLKLSLSGDWQKEMVRGTYDAELFSYLKKDKLEGKVIYDIGAHICYHSLVFAKYVGDKGSVYAFEPNPVNVKRAEEILDLNLGLKSKITLFNAALSDHTGKTTFLSTDNIEGGTSTGGFINEATPIWERSIYINKTGFTESQVKIDSIDNIIKNNTALPPDILKIDVEGAEQLVLAGAIETLKKYRPKIIVEFHSIHATYECMRIFAELDYMTNTLKEEPDGRVMVVATTKI